MDTQITDRHMQLWHLHHMDYGKMDRLQGYIVDTFERFCMTEVAACTGSGLRSHYYSMLKAGHKIKADGTSAISQARDRASQRRPKITPHAGQPATYMPPGTAFHSQKTMCLTHSETPGPKDSCPNIKV